VGSGAIVAVSMIVALLVSVIVYMSAPLWGVEATSGDRRIAALLTVLAFIGFFLVDPHIRVWISPLLGILSIVAVVDRRHRLIPNRLVIATLIWALGERLYDGAWLGALMMALAIFLFYLGVHVITHGGLGMGDVKFGAVLALGLGYPAGLISLVAGTWAAGIYAIFLLARHRDRHAVMALGPFLAFGGLVGLLDLFH